MDPVTKFNLKLTKNQHELVLSAVHLAIYNLNTCNVGSISRSVAENENGQ